MWKSTAGHNYCKNLNMQTKILIADDDEGIRDIFKILLERHGYSLEIKSNGEDILAGNFDLPHLFLLDKQLSGQSGLDVCRYLKSNPRTSHLPVIIVSASPDIATLSKQAGADAFIEKPFEISVFLEMIAKYSKRV